jgi:hypothetical protein
MINRVGKILSKMGFEHFKKNGRKVYALNLLKEENTIELVPMSHEVELYQAG